MKPNCSWHLFLRVRAWGQQMLAKVGAICLSRPAHISSFIAVMVASLVVICWRAGHTQALELLAYDLSVRYCARALTNPERVVIVGATEEDVRHFGWPLADDQLANFLHLLTRFKPRVIGLDLYRDLPEPRTGEHVAELEAVLSEHSEIIAIYNVNAPIDAPPVLADCPERIGFNDLPADAGKVVRRGLLLMHSAEHAAASNVPAFALQVTRRYLATQSIFVAPDPVAPQRLRLGRAALRPFECNDGAYVGADDAGYQFMLDFRRAEVPVFSMRQIHERAVDPARLHDRVVVMGVRAESVRDLVQTPLGKLTHGVDLQALIIDQLLRMALDGARPIESIPEWLEMVWIIASSVLGAVIGHRVRTPLRFMAATAGGLALMVGIFLSAFSYGIWIPLGAPALAFVPALGLVTSYSVWSERSERRTLMQLFSRHVSRDIAELLWQQRSQTKASTFRDWHTCTATVLFCDLRGFSTFSERTDPQVLVRWIDQYLDRMAAVVLAHNGVINKFIGDAIMAVFGVPVARTTPAEIEEDAANSVRCSLAMRRALEDLNREWAEQRLPCARMRVGIFTGPVAAGCVGSAQRMEFTVIGDTVNTAARLESFDRESKSSDPLEGPCRILIGGATRSLLGERFDLESLGLLHVKGKEEPVAMYRVLGEREK